MQEKSRTIAILCFPNLPDNEAMPKHIIAFHYREWSSMMNRPSHTASADNRIHCKLIPYCMISKRPMTASPPSKDNVRKDTNVPYPSPQVTAEARYVAIPYRP